MRVACFHIRWPLVTGHNRGYFTTMRLAEAG
jgi:hypothetical protein